MERTFKSAQSAYLQVLADIRDDGFWTEPVIDSTSVGSMFGQSPRRTKEIVNYSFCITNPTNRLVITKNRRVNPAYAIANTLWTLRGDENLESIIQYNERGASFSNDGVTLAGAVGKRLFSLQGRNQVDAVVAMLRADPVSRRAAIHIHMPDDLFSPILDTPCTLSLQFFIRAGRLILITCMRSQSALMLLPYDLFLFTMLQEALALQLGVGVGYYHHMVASIHYYEDEVSLVDKVLSEKPCIIAPMPSMISSPIGNIELMTAEEDFRRLLSSGNLSQLNLEVYDIDTYWSHLLHIAFFNICQSKGVLYSIPNSVDLDPAYTQWTIYE